MTKRIVWFTIPTDQEALARKAAESGDGYELIGTKDFPPFLPPTLIEKCDVATKIVSGNGTNHAIVMYNFLRKDRTKIDEHPFGYVLVSGSTVASSSFLEHGDWPNRTSEAPIRFLQHVSRSGSGDYFLAHPLAGRTSGSLDELSGTNRDAFEHFLVSASAAHEQPG